MQGCLSRTTVKVPGIVEVPDEWTVPENYNPGRSINLRNTKFQRG